MSISGWEQGRMSLSGVRSVTREPKGLPEPCSGKGRALRPRVRKTQGWIGYGPRLGSGEKLNTPSRRSRRTVRVGRKYVRVGSRSRVVPIDQAKHLKTRRDGNNSSKIKVRSKLVASSSTLLGSLLHPSTVFIGVARPARPALERKPERMARADTTVEGKEICPDVLELALSAA